MTCHMQRYRWLRKLFNFKVCTADKLAVQAESHTTTPNRKPLYPCASGRKYKNVTKNDASAFALASSCLIRFGILI